MSTAEHEDHGDALEKTITEKAIAGSAVTAGTPNVSNAARIFDTRSDYRQALRDAFTMLAAGSCREVWCCDADYAEWPLSDVDVLAALSKWALPHRRIVFLARSFDEVPRQHARFVQWRRAWSHVVDCRQLDEADAGDAPSLFHAPGIVSLQRFGIEQYRGSFSEAAADGLRCRDRVDALLQRSVASFPATTLGL